MMKKLFSLLLCLCMALSMTGAVADEAWDAAYDVVVIGFGGAGGAAAIEAADAGAKVLVLEKAPATAAGGNTKICGQQVLSPSDVDAAMEYFDAFSEGFVYDKELVRATYEGMKQIGEWMMKLGAPDLTQPEHQLVYREYPEFAGSEVMRCYLIDGQYFSGKVYKLLMDGVEVRSDLVDVWYESPAVELVQEHETGMIVGVIAEHEGETVRIKAENGVVMAMGGYENNQEMIQNYFHMLYGYPKGTYYNTGDGVIMAQKARI